MKKFLIVICCIILGVGLLLYNFSIDKKDLASDFSSKDIKKIKLGMKLQEVEMILGRPYEINSLAGLHHYTCSKPKHMLSENVSEKTDIIKIVNNKFSETDYCCEGNKDDLEIKRVTLVYSKRKEFSKSYPMLWVHLDSGFQVESVFAKRYDGLLGMEDPCIYSLDPEGYFEDEKLLAQSFD